MKRASAKAEASTAVDVVLDSGHTVRFDEPSSNGGEDLGPSATEGVSAALAACTVATMRLYADRKEWDVTGVEVEVSTEYRDHSPSHFRVDLKFPETLDEEQVGRLKVIAAKCPVHKILAGSVPVDVR